MADTIGSYSFTRLDGKIPVPQPILQDISRDGVGGIAYRILPNKGMPATLNGLAFLASADMQAATSEDGYASLTGTVVTITVANVYTFDDYLVLNVEVPSIPKLVVIGGSYFYRVESIWTVRSTDQ